MKRWIKRTLIGLLSTSVLFGGLTAYAHNRMHGMGAQGMGTQMSDEDFGRMRARIVERAGKELSLDDAQKQRLTVLADKLREQRTALMAGGQNPRAEMKALVAGPKFDRAAAQGLVDSKTQAIRSKGPEVITAAADFYDSLNPTQQQKVREFMDRRGGRHPGPRG